MRYTFAAESFEKNEFVRFHTGGGPFHGGNPSYHRPGAGRGVLPLAHEGFDGGDYRIYRQELETGTGNTTIDKNQPF
jgi:hypothetical protein